MSFKESIEKELKINSKIGFKEACLRIDNLKEKTFNNVKSEWKKKNGNNLENPEENPNYLINNSGNKTNSGSKLEKGIDDLTTLNSESIEKLLVNALKKQPYNANLIGKATEFFLKVKNLNDTMEDELDMEALLELGIVKKFDPDQDQKIPENKNESGSGYYQKDQEISEIPEI